ncbi:sensor histidine kinase [Clostridium lacusfryxellense]|uniref:sensor histidine kinase n=1 Tax=Clostridium lacusfryxellense TaxID=205328 RepID=UPI001C0E4F0F|nr:HAMP domain-containing sensor histidine kinase [Clostridium lacusfryxellense]MBU3114066.1 HAMP domain-containing histidine kinase [Clostridium lacusfryxellense]
MFKELKKRFLILNLVIISIMMLIAFSSIYLITYNNVHRNIDMQLHKTSDINRNENEKPKGERPDLDDSKSPQDRSLSFSLTIDKEGNIESYFSILNMDSDFYEEAKEAALSNNNVTGEIKLEDNQWAYLSQSDGDGQKIAFLDVTSEKSILTNLIFTFLVVAFVMLIIIFFISKFFATKSIEPIKDAFDKQKQFIADASHELKTPLAVINTNVDVLLSSGEENIKNGSKWLYYIKSEIERMTKLTNDLLYLTQVDYSDIKMISSNFSVSEATQNVILNMEAVIFENNITLEYNIEPDLKIFGNSEQIKQVVMILLDNALKYTGVKGTVNVNLNKYQNNIRLSVENTGDGIPQDCINQIFDRFYRIDKSRSRNNGGYGLGLAIAKAIIEQHRGKISVKSVQGVSTIFSVEFPA